MKVSHKTLGLLALLGICTPSYGLAQSALAAQPKSTVAANKADAKAQQVNNPCAIYGKAFFQIADTGICGRVGGSILALASKDFATVDIGVVGQRIPTAHFPGGAVPMLFYYGKDVSNATKYPGFGLDGSLNFLASKKTEYGTLVGFVNLTLSGNLKFDANGDSIGTIDKPQGTFGRSLVGEAWLRWGDFQAGIQPSLFGFSRTGYSVTPGYTSVITTPAISVVHRFGEVASLGVSIEDPTRRNLTDGVLAREAPQHMPDFVTQIRIGSPTMLLHLSGALHQSHDRAANDCCLAPENKKWGSAVSLGGEYRWKWSQLLGNWAGDTYGRWSLSGAFAKGAIGYLGIPNFVTDYVSDADGKINAASGQSIVTSYEHLWTPTLKSAVTYTWFSAAMHSSPAVIVAPGPALWFDYHVRGSRLQVGMEDMPQPNLTVGVEGSYTWSKASGSFAGFGAAPVNVTFPSVVAYVRRSF